MSSADDKKLGELLVGFRPALFALVRRRVGDRETANEILQEVSLRALAGEGPRSPDGFLSWICGIARHLIGKEWLRRRRARAQQSLEDPGIDEIRDPVAQPDERFEARASLERAIGVDSKSIALLFRRYLDNVSDKDLASEMSLTPTALRMRLMRIRSSARARYDDRDSGRRQTGERPPHDGPSPAGPHSS
jgi:RNA polymerase sigma factor (sigma-70 family)